MSLVSLPSPPPAALPSAEQSTAGWFAQEIQVHEPALKSYLRHSFPDACQEVDDVVQESYLRICRACARQRLVSAKAFLFKVARHVAVDFLRRQHRTTFAAVGDSSALHVIEERRGVAEIASMDEKLRLLVQGLATLPPRGREVVMLRKIKLLSQKEVARQLGVSEKTVDEHLYRSLKRLGKYLRARGVVSYFDR